jgi:hypothetical protein
VAKEIFCLRSSKGENVRIFSCVMWEIHYFVNKEGRKEGRKNYRRLRNELTTATDRAMKEYLGSIYDEAMEFHSTGCCDLVYLKTQGLGWKENQVFQNIGIAGCQGNVIVD